MISKHKYTQLSFSINFQLIKKQYFDYTTGKLAIIYKKNKFGLIIFPIYGLYYG